MDNVEYEWTGARVLLAGGPSTPEAWRGLAAWSFQGKYRAGHPLRWQRRTRRCILGSRGLCSENGTRGEVLLGVVVPKRGGA